MHGASPAATDSGRLEQLAAFAIERTDFPPAVVNEGKRLILDQLGCQIACAPLPWSAGYRDAARWFGAGEGASTVYYGDRLPLDQAAFVNGAFGQGGELDDTHMKASTHSGAVILPAVLAIAENRRLPGKQALAAVIVGVEVMLRVAIAARPHLHARGHHVPPAVGPFGAAAAVIRAMGLDREICLQAMAVAGSHSAGLMEYTNTGGSVKRCHCAIGAASGLRSAILAMNGITGPRSVLDGERGFLPVFAGKYDAEQLTAGLGADYWLTDMGYKTITCAYPSHAPLEALGLLQREHRFQPEDIVAIDAGMSHLSVEHVGKMVEPKDITDAHYSLAFSMAIRLLRGGNGLFDYREEDLADPRFLGLARKVRIHVDQLCEEERSTINARSGVVTVTLRDGKRLTQKVTYAKGHPMNPLTDDEMTAKFRSIVAPTLGEARTDTLVERLWGIEDLPDAGELIRLTFRPR